MEGINSVVHNISKKIKGTIYNGHKIWYAVKALHHQRKIPEPRQMQPPDSVECVDDGVLSA